LSDALLPYHVFEVSERAVDDHGGDGVIEGDFEDEIAPGNVLHGDVTGKPAKASWFLWGFRHSVPHEGEDDRNQAVSDKLR
jgi:hypothetical protein